MVAILETLPWPRSKWQSPIPVNRNVLLKLLRWHNDKRMHLCYHIKFVTSYDFLNCSIGFFSFLFWVSTERWRRLAQFRWNEHLHYVCIPPEVRSLKGCKCASLCAYLIGDAALHTCTNWHWIKVSPPPPPSGLSPTPAVPSHDPIMMVPLFYSAMQSARMDNSKDTFFSVSMCRVDTAWRKS